MNYASLDEAFLDPRMLHESLYQEEEQEIIKEKVVTVPYRSENSVIQENMIKEQKEYYSNLPLQPLPQFQSQHPLVPQAVPQVVPHIINCGMIDDHIINCSLCKSRYHGEGDGLAWFILVIIAFIWLFTKQSK